MTKSDKKIALASAELGSTEQDLIEAWARKHRVEFPIGEKVLWLTRVLRAITVSEIGRDFALMGGSAIVFLYRDMYRFSTDLDLDFVANRNLGKKGKREVSTRKKRDKDILKAIARNLRMEFKIISEKADRFVSYELTYRSMYKRRDSIELDISYRYGDSVLGTVSREWPIVQNAVAPRFKVVTLKEEELYASKAIAMVDSKERLDFPDHIGLLTKRKIRHLFDIYLLAREVLDGEIRFDLPLFRDLVILFGMTRIGKFEYFRGNAIGSYTEADVKSELLSVVPRDLPLPSVEEMKWTVRKFFDLYVFNYTEREHRFMEDFRAGQFRPEDLFATKSVVRRLRNTQYYREILGKVTLLREPYPSRKKRERRKSTT